jgi:hypothetical protein
MFILLTITAIMPTITATLSRLSRPKLRAGERALFLPAVRRQPGLKRWKTFDSVGNGSANGHGAAQARSLSITEIASQIVAELRSCNVIAIGPTVIGDGMRTPAYYCAACSADDGGFFTLIVGGEDLDDAVQTRATVKDQLRSLGKVVMVFKTEIALAVEVEKIWPCAQTTEIRQLVESGR